MNINMTQKPMRRQGYWCVRGRRLLRLSDERPWYGKFIYDGDRNLPKYPISTIYQWRRR